MALVAVTAPSNKLALTYGASKISFAPGGTDNIPRYMLQVARDQGFTSTDTDPVDVGNELNLASAQELPYIVLAWGMSLTGMTRQDILDTYNKIGAPTQ